jgi:hypothetical protein
MVKVDGISLQFPIIGQNGHETRTQVISKTSAITRRAAQKTKTAMGVITPTVRTRSSDAAPRRGRLRRASCLAGG